MTDDDLVQRARNEPQTVELLRSHNNGAADAWLKGYADAYQGRDLNPPKGRTEAYLRGYISGLKAEQN